MCSCHGHAQGSVRTCLVGRQGAAGLRVAAAGAVGRVGAGAPAAAVARLGALAQPVEDLPRRGPILRHRLHAVLDQVRHVLRALLWHLQRHRWTVERGAVTGVRDNWLGHPVLSSHHAKHMLLAAERGVEGNGKQKTQSTSA